MTAEILPFPVPSKGNGALELIRRYLADVYPSRRHGATDCGEYLDGSGNLPDEDHFLVWLAAEGYAIVPLEDALRS